MTPTERRAHRAARIAHARTRLPARSWLRARIEPLILAGQSDDQVARQIATALDGLFALDRLIPGPVGQLAEAVDGEILYAVALPIVKGVRRALVKAQIVHG
jgi:hypothetical protein